MEQTRRVFISYSHCDIAYKIELEKHLSPLFLMKKVAIWTDRDLRAGQALYENIASNIKSADIILLLISSDYLYSSSCIDEMEVALSRSRDQLATAIPIIVRFCDWEILPLGKILAIPQDGNPVSTWPDQDKAWRDVVRQIRVLIEDWELATSPAEAGEIEPTATVKVSPSSNETGVQESALRTSEKTEKWVFRREVNSVPWEDAKSALLARLQVLPELDAGSHLAVNVKKWGSRLLADFQHPSLTNIRRLWIDDVGGGPGYPGYQLRVVADDRLGMRMERLRWVEMTDGRRLLIAPNKEASEAFTAEGYADHLWHRLKAAIAGLK